MAGAWTKVAPDDLTTDLMELSFFCEVAWLKLANVDLAAGQHTLEIRLPRYKNAKGENQRMLFALDAICISAGEFLPHGPAQARRGVADRKGRAGGQARLPVARDRESCGGASEREAGRPVGGLPRIDEQLARRGGRPDRAISRNSPFWTAIEVPGDKNERADLVFAHRLWYRTHVNVPASHAGRSFHVVFPANSLNTTVYVNGVYCGFDKNPLARVQIDVTEGHQAGQVNEIWVGIKDIWYGREADPKNPAASCAARSMIPAAASSPSGFQALVYPVWDQKKSGIVGTPELVSRRPAYAADVFAKPSVARKELGLEVTLAIIRRRSQSPASCSARRSTTRPGGRDDRAGRSNFTPGRQGAVLDFAPKWENPKLWWPDEPNLYRLRTTVKIGGKPVDVKETLFGFREWSMDGIHLRLNGINWQGFSEMGTGRETPEDLIAIMKTFEAELRLRADVARPRRRGELPRQGAGGFSDHHGPRRA